MKLNTSILLSSIGEPGQRAERREEPGGKEERRTQHFFYLASGGNQTAEACGSISFGGSESRGGSQQDPAHVEQTYRRGNVYAANGLQPVPRQSKHLVPWVFIYQFHMILTCCDCLFGWGELDPPKKARNQDMELFECQFRTLCVCV